MNPSALPFPRGLQMSIDDLLKKPIATTVARPSYVAQTSSSSGLRLQLSWEEWETLKPLIRLMYIEENQTLPYIQEFLAKSQNFRPTKKQFASKIKEWEIKKNLKRSAREDILQTVGPIEEDIAIDSAGRKHKKQKLLRWQRENLTTRPSIVSTQSSRDVGGLRARADFSEPSSSKGPIPVSPDEPIDRDLAAAAAERERPVWVKGDEEYKYFPHAHWMNADVPHSPTLTRLLEGLAKETRDLPSDIEELILPPAIIERPSTSVAEVITWSDLIYQPCNDNRTSIYLIDGETAATYSENTVVNGFTGLRSSRSEPRPFRFRGSDAWFPSGIEVQPVSSPFNELYPFPSSCFGASHGSGSRISKQNSCKKMEIELSKKLSQLKGAGADETQPAMLRLMQRLANAFFIQHKDRQAEGLYRKVLAAQQKDPGTWIKETFLAQIALIACLCDQGKVLESKTKLESIHAAVVQKFQPAHLIFRRHLVSRISLAKRMKDLQANEAMCRDLIQICLFHLGPRHPETLDAMLYLAIAMKSQERYVENEQLQRFTVQIYQEAHKELHEDICWSFMELANVLERRGRAKEAIKLYRAASGKAKEQFGVNDSTTIQCNHNLGLILSRNGLLQESEDLLASIVRLRIENMEDDDNRFLREMYNLGHILHQRGKYQESATWLEKCFGKSLTVLPLDLNIIGHSSGHLGSYYERQGYGTKAVAIYQETIRFLQGVRENQEVDMVELQCLVSQNQIRIDRILVKKETQAGRSIKWQKKTRIRILRNSRQAKSLAAQRALTWLHTVSPQRHRREGSVYVKPESIRQSECTVIATTVNG